MNTPYLYICEIPADVKPVLLLTELKNKWARMLYLESDLGDKVRRSALVYCRNVEQSVVIKGVEAIRARGDGIQVYYVWFPPTNVSVTTMIPAGASMLSYILVENIHKDVIPSEVIYDLPIQMSDIKTWDIAERRDKCLLIKLPYRCKQSMRSFVLASLRSRPVRGMPVCVSEMIISEESELCSQMVPCSIKMTDTKKESYISNFLYIHEIPSNLTVKMLIEIPKTENIRGSRVFFIETSSNMKYGFMYVPRSLPNVRFVALHEKIKETEFELSENSVGKVKIDQTWFRPFGADAPIINDGDGEMILTEYLYLKDVPPYLQPSQLVMGCPWKLKLYLFTVNEISTQIGFVVLRGLSEEQVCMTIEYLRNLDFNGVRIQVEEVYIYSYDLSEDIKVRPFQLQPRICTIKKTGSIKKILDNNNQLTCAYNGIENNIVILSNALEYDNGVMKSDFICVDNLPKNVSKAALVFDIGRASDGCIIIPRADHSTAFLYFPECDINTWKGIVKKLCFKYFGESIKRTLVYEVYLKPEITNTSENTEFKDTNIVFIYNIAKEVNNKEVCDLNENMIEYAEILDTDVGSKSAFVLLKEECDEKSKQTFIDDIRKKFLRGKPIYADVFKLAQVRVVSKQNDVNGSLK